MLLKILKQKTSLKLVIMLILIIPLIGTSVFASEAPIEEGAKTPPPPVEIGVQGDFDPRHIYLDKGFGDISDLGNGRVELWGRTTASTRVDTVGVQLILQRWTGSTWVDEVTSGEITRSNSSTVEGSHIRTVVRGYYYRVKSVHWANHGNTRERGELVTNSILVR